MSTPYVRAEKPSMYGSTEEDARGALLSGVGDIERGSDGLRSSNAMALQTEEIGQSVLSDLQRQKETIRGTAKEFDSMEESHNQLDGVLRNMGFNAITNKYLCYFVIFLIVCTFIMVFVLSLSP